MILYFSGTGNSRYVAEKIAKITGDGLLNMGDRIRNHETGNIETGEELIIVVPTYAWRIPHIVEQWFGDTVFPGVKKVWFVMTCGDEAGNAGKYNRRFCEERHWTYMGTAEIIMPENYIAMFAVPKPATAQKIIQNAGPSIDIAAQNIARGKAFAQGRKSVTDRLKSSIVNQVFYAMAVKANAFRTTKDCIGCGQCTKRCPLNNITLTDGKPVWGRECTHCMACISYCPTKAIEYGRKSIGKPRYHCDL